MKRTFNLVILACFILSSCNSISPASNSEHFTIQYTAASIPELAKLYDCASGNEIDAKPRGTDFLDPSDSDMVIRVGQPSTPTLFAYQIASDSLVVIVNLKNPATEMTADQVRGLFTGEIQTWKTINGSDAPVHPWVYPASEDIQAIIKQTILDGSPVSSDARLANNPSEMLEGVEKDINAVGIISLRWKNEKVLKVFAPTSSFPVMAITRTKPQGSLAQILACMQK
jgi:phosphate transport system substrate-binding protein